MYHRLTSMCSTRLWVVSFLLVLTLAWSILGQSSAQLKVYSETSLKVEPIEDRWLSSFVVLGCIVEPVNATIPTRWVLPNGHIINQSGGRYRMGQGRNENGTWSTLLAVQNVSYRDEGFYTCEVVPRSISRSQCECVDFPFSVTTELQLKVSLDAVEDVVLVSEGATESVQLGCEMKGFLRPDEDLLWYKDHKLLTPTKGRSYSVAVKDGTPGAGQDGRNETVHSRLSVLVIKHPKVDDSGVYSCKVRGTDAEANIVMTVSELHGKGLVTNKPNPDGSKGQDDITTTTPVRTRGNKLDAKNERDLLSGGRNSNTLGQSPGCSLGPAELVAIVVTTCIVTAALSTLLTITIGYFCLKRKQQRSKMSENKQTAVPDHEAADDHNMYNRRCWQKQEESSLDSTIVSGADVNVGGCVGTAGAAPDHEFNSSKREQNVPGESN